MNLIQPQESLIDQGMQKKTKENQVFPWAEVGGLENVLILIAIRKRNLQK